MSRGRKVIVVIALIMAAVVMAGRMTRQDSAYIHARHISEIHDCRPLTA